VGPTNLICKASSAKDSTPQKENGFGTNASVSINKSGSIELLESGQYSLAIHDIVITSDPNGTDTKTNQQIYSIKLTIGTNVNNTIDNATHLCFLPDNVNYDSMCYTNYFTVVVRAGNKVQ